MNWNFEKELERLIWYLLGFNDGEIGALSEPVVGKSNVCSWRGRRGLLPNNGLSDRKYYSLDNPLDNPLNRVLGGSPGHPLSEEREEFLRRLYDEGLNDVEIAERAGRTKTTIRTWRLRKGLSPNAIRGGQPNQKSGYKIVKREGGLVAEKEELLFSLYNEGLNDPEIAEKVGRDRSSIRRWRMKRGLPANATRGRQPNQNGEHRIRKSSRKRETKKESKLSARRLAEEAERAIVESLPSKEEVYQKVRNSSRGKITTKTLIKQRFGDVGHSRLGQGGRGDTVHKLGELVDEGLLALNTDEKDKIIWRA